MRMQDAHLSRICPLMNQTPPLLNDSDGTSTAHSALQMLNELHSNYSKLTSLLVLLLPECTRAVRTQCFPRYCQAQMQRRAQQREAVKETPTRNVTLQ